MRTFVVILIAIVLGGLFIVQKQRERLTVVAKTEEKVVEKKAVTPRPVSEHNWAKHSLDRTRTVIDQVAKQRQEDGARK